MKKLLATLLAAILLLACIPALADAPAPKTHFAELGLDLDITAITDKCVYTASIETEGILDFDPYVAMADVYYCALPRQQLLELNKKLLAGTDEEQDAIYNYLAPLRFDIGHILVTNATDMDIAELMAYNDVVLDARYKIEEIGTLGDYRYYYIIAPTEDYLAMFNNPEAIGLDMTEEQARAMKDEISAEIAMVSEAVEAALRSAKPVEPHEPSNELVGQIFRFETADMDGNPVKSEDLFRDNKITMVNLWGTWCTGCVGELADLAKIHARLQEKGCGIVGMEYEQGLPLEKYKEAAQAIMTANGINYPNVQMPENNPVCESFLFFPATVFVDSEGKILCYPITGARVEDYEPTIDKLLAGEAVDVVPDNTGFATGDNKYTVTVYDPEGKPVEGVMIQFCDDQVCTLQATDAEGIAAFRMAEQKVYDIHVLQVPEGYREDTQSYKTLEAYSNVDIFLQKAE